MTKYNVIITYKISVNVDEGEDPEMEAWKTIDAHAIQPKVEIKEDDE